MADKEWTLTALANLEGAEANRAWGEVQLQYADTINKYFTSLKGPVAVPPDEGLKETISWARRKIHYTIERAMNNRKIKIPSLSKYLLNNASLVHDLKLYDEFKKSSKNEDSAWKAMVEKYNEKLKQFIDWQCDLKGITARGYQEPADFLAEALKRAKTNLSNGKFDPEKGTLKTHFFNMAEYALKDMKFPPEADDVKIEDIDGPQEWGRIAGGRPKSSGEIPPEVLRQELLGLVLAFGGKPHQVIAFGFTQLLEVDVGEFVRERSELILNQLGTDFCHDYYILRLPSFASKNARKKPCDYLFDELEKLVKVVYELKGASGKVDVNNRRTYPKLTPFADKKVGAVCMSAFYSGSPRNNVYGWCYDVKDAVKEKLGLNKKRAVKRATRFAKLKKSSSPDSLARGDKT